MEETVVEGNNKQDFVAISNSPTLAIFFNDVLKHAGVPGEASCPE